MLLRRQRKNPKAPRRYQARPIPLALEGLESRALLSTVFLSDCNLGFHSGPHFANETVCVSGDVDTVVGDTVFPSADVYVTTNRVWSAGDELAGLDVTGNPGGFANPNTVIGLFGGGAFFDEIVWLPPLTPGEYDIVLDEDRDGFFNDPGGQVVDGVMQPFKEQLDRVLGAGTGFAFVVVPAPLDAFFPNVAAIKLDALAQIANWKSLDQKLAVIGYLKTELEAAGQLTNPNAGVGVALAVVSEALSIAGLPTDYNDAVLARGGKVLNDLSALMQLKYTRLANDPPDPDFRKLVSLDITELETEFQAIRLDGGLATDYPFPPVASTPLEAATQRLVARLSEQAAILDALVTSQEKYTGAQAVHDLTWAVIHAEGISRYAGMLSDSLQATRDAAIAVRTEILALPLGAHVVNVDIVRTVQARVATSGFTVDEIRGFKELGFTDAQMDALAAHLTSLDLPSESSFSVVSVFDDLIAAQDTILASTQGLAANAASLKSDLENVVLEVADPDADVAGPYAGTVGVPLSLDASASVSNAASLIFAWDLDLDGQFDDAVGPTPVVTFDTPGTRHVGVRVTNDLGLADIDYATASMALGNAAPVITDFQPEDVRQVIAFGSSLAFSVAATDPDGDALTFKWLVDGVEQATGTTFTYSPTVDDFGGHLVRVIVSDTDPFSPDAIEQRLVSVVFPDADGDGFRSNDDCDDGNAAVNPGAPEGVGNGINDDCNDATPDGGSDPVAAFFFLPNPPVAGLTVEFTDLSSDPNDDIGSLHWDFGDGGTSAEEEPTHTYASGGTFIVSLTATDAQGRTNTATQAVTVLAPPVADFSFAPDAAHVSAPTQFTSRSVDPDGVIVAFAWDFDNDSVTDSTLENPVHTFTSTGSFPVSLTVTDNDGLTRSLTKVVVVAVPPIPDFDFSPAGPVVGQNVQFTDLSTDDGAVVTWAWDFENDGLVDSREQHPLHVFLAAGAHAVRLTVTDNEGASQSTTKTVDVGIGLPPLASFTFLPSVPVRGEPVQFTDASTDPDNAIVAREWDFESDGVFDSTEQHPMHVYPTFGNHNVTLRVTDQAGNTGQLTVNGIPVRARPVAAFTPSTLTPNVGDVVTFTDTSTDDDSPIASRSWDFGDGGTSSLQDPTHTFPFGGIFNIRLTVIDVHGLSDTATVAIGVVDPGNPTASFSFSPTAPAVGQSVQFTDLSTDDGAVVAWAWDFEEDGVVDSTAQHPTHAYGNQGTFRARLTVTDNENNTGTTTRTITAGPGDPPTAAFSFDPTPPVASETTFFFDQSTDPDNAIVQSDWSFGDGATSTLHNPSHTYSTFGVFDISLKVTDEAGNTSTRTIADVPVLARPVADFAFSPASPVNAGEPVQFTDASTDADNAIVSFAWDFQTDGVVDSTVQNPAHTFLTGGTFGVTLAVTDATGLIHSVTKQVAVLAGVEPTADFSFAPVTPAPGQPVQFTDESTDDGAIVSWEWDFENDGTSDNFVRHPVHVFQVGGDYSVRLTVADDQGLTASVVVVVSVPTKPLAQFTTGREMNVARLLDGASIAGFSSVNTSFPPENAIDNNASSAWASRSGHVDGEYVAVELIGLTLHSVQRIFIESSTSTDAINGFEFQISTTGFDDADFTTVLVGAAPRDNVGQSFNLDSPVDARYVRLVAQSNHGGTRVHVEQFQVFDAANQNVALLEAGAKVVDHSSVDTSVPPENAIDDGADTSWRTFSGKTTNEFLMLDLAGDLHVMDRIFIEGHDTTNAVRNFEVLLSTTGTEPDDFTLVFSGVSPLSRSGATFTFPPVQARFVMLRALDNYGSTVDIRVDQFQVFTRGNEGGIVSLREGPRADATASSVNGTSVANNAIDESASSIWRSTGNVGESILVELAGAKLYTIDRLQLASTLVSELPKDFEVRVSTTTADDAAFTTVFAGTTAASTDLQEFTFPPAEARYVQVQIHSVHGATACCVRLSELHIFDVEGRKPSRREGVGSLVVDFSSRSATSTSPEFATDFSSTNLWTTASGQVTDQWFKLALLKSEDGRPYLIDRIQMQGSSSSNGAHDFELRVSTTGFVDPATSDDATRLDDPNFRTVLTGTLPQDNLLHWFTFPPVHATHVQLVVRNTHSDSATSMTLNTLRVFSPVRGGAAVPFDDHSVDPGGRVVSWDWDFGDGQTSTEQHPVHAYEAPGTYRVTLRVTDDEDFSDTVSFVYTVLRPPAVSYTPAVIEPLVEGQSVPFRDTSTDALGDPIMARLWTLSHQLDTSLSPVNVSFPDNVDVTVSLSVTDNQFMNAALTRVFTPENVPPTVNAGNDFSISWGVPFRTLANGMDFRDVSADIGPTAGAVCDVDYGDGQTVQVLNCTSGAVNNIFHAYAEPGVYTMVLVVTDKDGGVGSDTRTITALRRDSHVTIWGEDALRPPEGGGPVVAHARLVDFDPSDRHAPVAGRTITFSLGAETQDVVTSASGEAQATFHYAPGRSDRIVASFAGDSFYEPSMDRPFILGDLVAAVGDGMAHRHDAAGNFVNVFDSRTGSSETAGMCFDSADNLYLTSFQASRASKFNRSTGQVITNWAVGFSQKPESCVLAREDIDGDGEPDDVLYFGEVDGQELIRKFDTHGNLLGTFDPETRDRGVDWIDLAADGRTMYYTTEGDDILRYDIVADVQLPDFVPDQTVATNRFLPRADSLPENAIDADVNSTWLTEVTLATNEWFIVDLIGETQTIKGVFIEGSTSLQAVRNFHVQVSTTGTDEADFTTVLTEVSPRNNIGASFTFPAVDARFVRLFAIDNYGGSNIGVNQFKVFNTADQNVASLEGGATIVGVSSVRSDPLLTGPCFALRLLQDQSVLMACRGEVVHVSPDGRSLLASYSRAALGVPTTDTLFALNLDPDGTSFWTAAHSAARIVKAHIATGEVLLSFDAKKRGPTVAGLIVYGEPTAAVNSAPIADDQSLTTGENTPLAITLTARDPESDPLTFSIVTQPAHGVLSGIAPDIVYTPGLDFVGVDSFTFKANDGELDSNVATVAIEVLLVNSAPVANTGGPYVTVEGAMLMLDGTSSFDPDQRDQDTLTFEWDTDGDGEFNDAFTPTVEVSYPDLGLFTVALRVTDKHGASDQANTIVLVNTEPPTIGAGPDQEVDPGQTVNLAPATFTDPGAVDTHTATINWGDGTQTPGVVTQAPGGGTVDGSHVYLSAGMFTVLVCVTDDDGGTGCDTLTVTVNAITNAPPMADAGGPYSVDEGGSITLDGSASFDPDEGDSIVQFEWDLDGDGEFDDAIGATPTFSAALLDGPQTVTVRLRVTDAFGATAAGEADITVENVPPTAEEDLAVTDEYVSVSIDVLANDTDPAGTNDTLAITAVTDGAHGTVVVDDRGTADPADDLVVYTPALGFDGTDSFTYTISDGDGGTATGTVKVTVRNLVDLAGRVFDDLDNDGRFESNAGEVGIGGVTVELFDQTTGTLIGTQATAEDGTYAFDANLGAGIYKIVAVQATGYLDGSETAGNLGGTVDNTQDSNEIADIVVGTANASSDGVDYLFAEIRPSLIQGLVWNDFDNDGEVEFGEFGISDVEITLNGTDDRAGTVSLTQTTDAQGNYQFADLRPGSYEIIETQPGQPIHSVDYIDGKDVVGEVNGVLVGDNDGGSPPLSPTNDQFTGLLLAVPDSIGINYNFGERVDGGGFSSGQTATIGYWQNRNGKQLIQLLNGSADSTLLASWLSSTFPNMYAALGDSNGDGVADDPLTNAGVAELYQRLFRLNSQTAPPGPPKLDAQVLAVALSAYATEESFVVVDFATGAHDPTLVDQIESFGFDVTLGGVGARFFNVGGGGAAFNVADDSRVKIVDLLLATDAMSLVGLLYDDADSDGTGDGSIDDFERMLRVLANDVYTGINET